MKNAGYFGIFAVFSLQPVFYRPEVYTAARFFIHCLLPGNTGIKPKIFQWIISGGSSVKRIY